MSPLKAGHILDDTGHCTSCELLFTLEHGHFCWIIYPASRFRRWLIYAARHWVVFGILLIDELAVLTGGI